MLGYTQPILTATLFCLVVGISDGDTLTARCGAPGQYEQVKVRLQGIDAPERKQPFGERARQALAELTFQKEAELRCTKTDRYKRQVCSVWVAPASAPSGPRTLDAGLAMVTKGLAWWYRAYAREQSPQERGQYEFGAGPCRQKADCMHPQLRPPHHHPPPLIEAVSEFLVEGY